MTARVLGRVRHLVNAPGFRRFLANKRADRNIMVKHWTAPVDVVLDGGWYTLDVGLCMQYVLYTMSIGGGNDIGKMMQVGVGWR